MSDETPDQSAAPGSTASDAAPSIEVPRLSTNKPAEDGRPKSAVGAAIKSAAGASAGAAPEPAIAKAAEAQAEAEAAADDAKAEVEDSRPEAPERPHTPVVKTGPGQPKVEGVTPVARPITAGEYARTTSASASSTAVIPVVKDEPRPSPAQVAVASAGRQASLKLVRVDPWSVTKVVFALTVALMIVAVVAVTILWIVLSFAGVWDQINSSVTTVLSDDSSSFDITEYLGFTRIVGLTLVISAINVVIMTAVATIGAYLYNLAAQLLGGVDVTLAEED